MFRTINQTITAAKLWRSAFRALKNMPELAGYTNITLAHFGVSADAANERNTLSANMQYLRMLDSEAGLINRDVQEADRKRYYEFASEMSNLDYFHFSSANYT